MEILNTTPLTKTNAVKGGNLTALNKYEPEKLVMPRLPKFMIPKFATSEGGATDTMSEYVYKLSENYAQYVPRGYGYVSFFPSGLQLSPQGLYVVSRFLQLLEGGQIALIYEKINLYFSTPQWAFEKDFDENYYVGENRPFLRNIIAEVVTTVNVPLHTDTVRDLVFLFVTEPNTILDSLYQAVIDKVDFVSEWIKNRIDEANDRNEYNKKIAQSVWDPSGLTAPILRNKYKGLITEYFNQYFLVPNTSIYNSAKAFNSGLISYKRICSDNYKKATGKDVSFEFETLYLATQGSGSIVRVPVTGGDFDNKNAGNDNAGSDRTMLIVAIALLVGIFVLKRYKKN